MCALVLPQFGGRAERQHDDVETAVAVEIGDAASPMRRYGIGKTGCGGRVPESPMAVVDEEAVGLLPVDGFEVADPRVHMRVGREDVLPSIVVEVRDDRAPARRLHRQPRQTARLRGLDERAAAVVAKERERFSCEGGHQDVLPAVVVVILDVGSHARDRPARIGYRHAGEERGLFERAVALVPEQEVGNRVVGHECVEPSIVIEVRKGDAHALPDVRQQPRTRRHVLERAVAAIPVQAVGQTLEESRMAVDPDAASLIATRAIRLR